MKREAFFRVEKCYLIPQILRLRQLLLFMATALRNEDNYHIDFSLSAWDRLRDAILA